MAKKKQETLQDLKVVYRASDDEKVVKEIGADVKLECTGEHNGHSFVDLGLPSGLLWATCNVGASKPEDCGDYFAWGETKLKDSYTKDNYTYPDNQLTLSSEDDVDADDSHTHKRIYRLTLSSKVDAVAANWGEGWRMPTKEEFQELIDNCTNEWIGCNGRNGFLFTGTNGNSIFFPAARGRWEDDMAFLPGGFYWSSSQDSNTLIGAWRLAFISMGPGLNYFFREYGQPVRAVCQPQK